jgi:hypothetical protein
MWATAETWLTKAKSLFRQPPSDDLYPNDRLPSEQVVPTFALRGYRGPPVRVATTKYFEAKRLDGFIDRYTADMASRGWPFAKSLVERDVIRLEDLASASDAVLVIPSW